MSEGRISELKHDYTCSASEDVGVRLAKRLTDFLKEGVGCDVKFVVGTEHEVVLAHQIVLACSSEVFATMFYGKMAQSK
ncbi:unnamed protein product [Gongylonema pulchrum]|uniref:BTB domain-containing protein n=1 Tax=Gongylonema pulchrum TaxID=637853 RepID=A0A183DK21_9BILA|nr:unnamed protein product [Gongylonema pulchrum]